MIWNKKAITKLSTIMIAIVVAFGLTGGLSVVMSSFAVEYNVTDPNFEETFSRFDEINDDYTETMANKTQEGEITFAAGTYAFVTGAWHAISMMWKFPTIIYAFMGDIQSEGIDIPVWVVGLIGAIISLVILWGVVSLAFRFNT